MNGNRWGGFAAVLCAWLLAGCGGGGSYSTGLIPADFQLGASDSGLAATTKQASAAVTLTVRSIAGFSDPVTLTFAQSPGSAANLHGAFSAARVTPTPTGATTTLTITADTATLPAGAFPFTITGTAGAHTHTLNLTLAVAAPPDFSIAATNATQSVAAGDTADYALTLTSVAGFSSPVTLSATNLPAGATATFTPAPVTPTAAGTAVTLTITTTNVTTPPGSYTIPITATGGVPPTFSVTLNVTGFTVQISPVAQSLASGGTVTYTVTVTPLSGFTGTVALSTAGIPASIVPTFSLSSVTFAAGDAAKVSVLTLASIGVASFPITYPFTVTGASGQATSTASASVTAIR